MAELAYSPGEQVFLNVHLGDGATGMYVQAAVKNAAGGTMGGC